MAGNSFSYSQVLAGDINEAICNHAVHYTIWRKYGALPERFDFRNKSPVVPFYPLRPELVESTYFLYQVCTYRIAGFIGEGKF